MAKQIPTIYLHIGTIKTGTTSLQNFFYLNKNRLLIESNIYYPSTPGLKNHTNLPLYAYTNNISDIIQRKKITSKQQLVQFRHQFKKDFQNEIRQPVNKGLSILLSNEHLSSRAQDISEIQQLINLFQEFNVQIKAIVYLRRQDKMMLSTYSTWVKNGGKWDLNPEAYKNERYDYVSLVDSWAQVIGKENIIVRAFEKTRLKNGDLYEDFCSIFNIDTIKNWQRPHKEKLNESLDQDQLLFLRTFNKLVPNIKEETKNPLRGKIVQYLEETATNKRIDISHAQKMKIAAYFEKDNQLIKDIYLPDQEIPLFSPIQEENMEKELILSSEKAIAIAAYIYEQQQQRINRFKWLHRLWDKMGW